jgi:hypothetical protein
MRGILIDGTVPLGQHHDPITSHTTADFGGWRCLQNVNNEEDISVLKKSKIVFLSIAAVGFMASSLTAFAEKFSDAVENKEACPVTAYPTMPLGTDPTIALDLEFGNGAQAITQCLKNRKKRRSSYVSTIPS